MRVLFAINSWDQAAKNGFHHVIRETWGKDVAPGDLRFFIPKVQDYHLREGEIFLDVPREYNQISNEVREMLKWSVEQNYDYTVILSTDSFILPQRILKCGFEQYDYSGDFAFGEDVPFGEVNPIPVNCTFSTAEGYGISRTLYNWCGGGAARMISKKAASIIAENKAGADFWFASDDIFIGQVLGPLIKKGEITAGRIPDFGGVITWHYKNTEKETYAITNGWMKRMYEEHR